MKNKEDICMNGISASVNEEKELFDEEEEKIRQEVALEVMRLMDECD